MLNPQVEQALHTVRVRLLVHRDVPESAHHAVTNIVDQVRDQFAQATHSQRLAITNPRTYADIGRGL